MSATARSPDELPRVDGVQMARAHPELAMLAALAHVRDASGPAELTHVLRALVASDHDRAAAFGDAIARRLGSTGLEALMTAVRRDLEGDPSTNLFLEWVSEWLNREKLEAARSEGRSEGRAEGRAEALRGAVRALASALDVSLAPAWEARIDALDGDSLQQLLTHLSRHRALPDA